jgi:DNA transformation protein and related proteins
MDADGIHELFEHVGRVQLRRMFGGHGIYMDGVIIAIESDGSVFFKTDDTNRGMFVSRGSRPFSYMKEGQEAVVGTYWSLPASAFDDPDELRDLTWSSLAVSQSAQAAKARKKSTAASGSRRRAASRPED